MQNDSLNPNHNQPISSDKELLQLNKLRDVFPGTRWVLPTGKQRFVTALGREANAWFDVHDFKDRRIGEMESVTGLRESAEFLGDLIGKEIEILHEIYGGDINEVCKRVIIGGFSQGAAMSAVLMLSGEATRTMRIEGENFKLADPAGWVLINGWLPFRAQIHDLLANNSHGRENYVAVRNYLRKLLGLSASVDGQRGSQQTDTKVWITHGRQDQKMLLEWAEGLRDVLVMTGKEVEMEIFDVGHWWCEETLKAMTKWLSLTAI
jgi:predicted esterase